MASSKSTALGTCISCTFGFAFLEGLIPGVAQGPIGLVTLGIAVVSGVASLFTGRKYLGNAIKLLCAVGLLSVIGYALGTAPTNPLAQQVMGEQMTEMLRSLGTSMPAATVQQAPTLVAAATASTMMQPTPMTAPKLKQVSANTATPVVAADAPALIAIVFNGGNVRDFAVDGRVLDQINAHERVQLVKKNQQASWYFAVNQRNVGGWVSKTLLDIAAEADSQIPIAGE